MFYRLNLQRVQHDDRIAGAETERVELSEFFGMGKFHNLLFLSFHPCHTAEHPTFAQVVTARREFNAYIHEFL